VVEGADLEARVEGGGDEGVTTAERGAEDAELLVALDSASRCSCGCRRDGWRRWWCGLRWR
jgi:hypothetical protein